jgi:tetratricopeptide (TPR) repeat protein
MRSHDEFASAVRLHQAGDLAGAARSYEALLARDATHAEAFHLLGVLRHQQGEPGLAAELIGRSVALRPSAAVFRVTLAEAYRALGRFDDAADCCRAALRMGLCDPGVHNNLGLALLGLGRHTEAAQAFRTALARRPGDAIVHTNLGTALSALGEPEQALAQFRRAIALDPKLAPARSNLGQVLLDLGRANEALPHCEEAVALAPGLTDAQNNLGNAYRALGRFTEARRCYLEALRLNPGLAQAHVNLGLTSQQENHRNEALAYFRRACELQPRSLTFLGLLAEAAVEQELFAEAIACYEKILELDAGCAAAHNALGWLVQEQGRLDQAEGHLQNALRLQPDLAIAHVNMGGVFEKLGEFAAAEASFRRAMQDEKAHAPALARLAMLLRGKLPDPDRAALEERLARSDCDSSDPSRVNLLFGLAYVWDAQGRYAEAAGRFRQANALALAQLAERDRAYDPAEHDRFVAGLTAAFDQVFFARLAGAGLATQQPVFIFGLPRTGTTLVEQVLASHSQLHGAGELLLARQDFERIPELVHRDAPTLSCLAQVDAPLVRGLSEWHLERLTDLDGRHTARIADKMPDNYLFLGLLAVLFPSAVFIHCRRDLRDVAASCYMTGFRSLRWTNHPHHIVTRFVAHRRLMDHWGAVLPIQIHEVNYEEMVSDLEGVARRLLAACGLGWEPGCLEFHQARRPVRTASFAQVRQPVYRTSIGRWKNYENELADLFVALPPDA